MTVAKLKCYHLLLTGILLASCATLPTDPAPWATSPTAIRAVFPDSEYIAQRGRGKTRDSAQANAAAEIARYFTSQIQANFSARTTYRETNGRAEEQTEITDEMFVQSQINLFGIRYADDAFYDAAQKEWQTVAYIDRAEAWRVYGPRFKTQAETFHNLFDAAEHETDAFRKALRYDAAWRYAQTADFESAESLGQILDPAKMNAEFALARTELASLPQKRDSAKRNASVFIDCPHDFESLIANVFSRSFAAQGFPIASASNAAAAVCVVTVDDGEQKRDTGMYYYPSLQAVVSGSSGALWTFNAQAEKSAAVTPDVAKRRAYTALAEQVGATFAAQFNQP
jgi:hypothetical protein